MGSTNSKGGVQIYYFGQKLHENEKKNWTKGARPWRCLEFATVDCNSLSKELCLPPEQCINSMIELFKFY